MPIKQAYYTREALLADYPTVDRLRTLADSLGVSVRYTREREPWIKSILIAFEKFGLCNAPFILAEDRQLSASRVEGVKFWVDDIYLVENPTRNVDPKILGVDLLSGDKIPFSKGVLLSRFMVRECFSDLKTTQSLPELGIVVGYSKTFDTYDYSSAKIVSIFSLDNQPWRIGVDVKYTWHDTPTREILSLAEFNKKFANDW